MKGNNCTIVGLTHSLPDRFLITFNLKFRQHNAVTINSSASEVCLTIFITVQKLLSRKVSKMHYRRKQ